MVLVLAAAACSGGPSPEGPVVVATVWPFAWLADQVAPGAEIRQIPSGVAADPHDVELTPDEVRAIRNADAVLYVGDVDYQPAVESVVADTRGMAIAAITTEGDDVDPHVWHRPATLAALIDPLADALTDHGVVDEGRATELRLDLVALQSRADELLRSCPRDEVVVSHAGYGPLLQPLGIEQHALSGPHDHAEPTAGGLSSLADEVRRAGIPAVLAEPQEGREAAATVARETGVELIEILPLGTVTAEQADRGYVTLFRENVLAFARALGCEV